MNSLVAYKKGDVVAKGQGGQWFLTIYLKKGGVLFKGIIHFLLAEIYKIRWLFSNYALLMLADFAFSRAKNRTFMFFAFSWPKWLCYCLFISKNWCFLPLFWKFGYVFMVFFQVTLGWELWQRGNLIRHQRVSAFPKCIQEPLSQKGGPGV